MLTSVLSVRGLSRAVEPSGGTVHSSPISATHEQAWRPLGAMVLEGTSVSGHLLLGTVMALAEPV